MNGFQNMSLNEAADVIGVTPRLLGDSIREGMPFPTPFGRVGNSRLWFAEDVHAAVPAVRAWLAKAPERAADKRASEMRLLEEKHMRERAKHEQEMAQMRERLALYEELAAARESRKTPAQKEADRLHAEQMASLDKHMAKQSNQMLQPPRVKANEPKPAVLPPGMAPTATPTNTIGQPSDWTV